MILTDRRSAVRALAFAALAPMSSLGLGAGLARAMTPLAIPEGPVVLRRTLERALGDHATLSVIRAWECRFSHNGRGILVEGRQIDVSVDAPPSLTALAEIERKREVAGLFPAHLDANGRFADLGTVYSSSDVRNAVDVALAMVDKSTLPTESKADARQFLARLGATAAELVSVVPQDLFYPVVGQSKVARNLPLPEGVSGSLEVELSASAQPNGLLDCTEKRIVTRIEGSARIARECWDLRPA